MMKKRYIALIALGVLAAGAGATAYILSPADRTLSLRIWYPADAAFPDAGQLV